MEAFGQGVFSFHPGYFHRQNLMNMEVYSGENFNRHQLRFHQPRSSVTGLPKYPWPVANPYWWFGGSAISPFSGLKLNGPLYLPSGYVTTQVPILAPAAGYGKPAMPLSTNLNHDDDDIIKPERPPYLYVDLITMALENAPDNKLTFRQICSYVLENFPFYQGTDNSWHDSIRYNLTFRKCFKKVAWDDHDPEKGTCWTFNQRSKKMSRWQQKNISESKPSKELDHKRNITSLTYDSLAGSPESRVTSSSPALDTTDKQGMAPSITPEHQTHLVETRACSDNSSNDYACPSLDTSPCITKLPSTMYEMRSNWASIQLLKDFSSYKHYSAELSTYRTDDNHNSSLPGEPIAQANLPPALTTFL